MNTNLTMPWNVTELFYQQYECTSSGLDAVAGLFGPLLILSFVGLWVLYFIPRLKKGYEGNKEVTRLLWFIEIVAWSFSTSFVLIMALLITTEWGRSLLLPM